VEAVPYIIQFLERKGYQSVALDTCVYGQSGPEIFAALRFINPSPVQKVVIPFKDESLQASMGTLLGLEKFTTLTFIVFTLLLFYL
jgi:hypothetical protein